MSEGTTWDEIDASFRARVEGMRDRARGLYRQMIDHVTREIARTGADIMILAPEAPLPKQPGTAPIAIRMDVTPATANFTRQAYVDDGPGQKHRSWPINLESRAMPPTVRRGLTRFVEQVAELQGRSIERPQSTFDL